MPSEPFLFQVEFASAMALKPDSDFVENMFSLMDTDHNGYISFREFLNGVILLSKGKSIYLICFLIDYRKSISLP